MNPKKPRKDGSLGFIKSVIDAGNNTQENALGRAPIEHTGILQLGWIAMLFALAIGVTLIYKDQPAFGVIVILVSLVLAGLAMFLLRPERHSLLPTIERRGKDAVSGHQSSMVSSWARTTVRLPISDGLAMEMSEKLKTIRSIAQSKYTALLETRLPPAVDIDDNNVRINVFMPDAQRAVRGEVCGMGIPDHFSHGMRDKNEKLIRFRPNEGLTGRVFTFQKAFGALRETQLSTWDLIVFDRSGSIGDESFNLTLEQVNQINKDLRWAVCFPLQAVAFNKLQTFAVLNIDGLHRNLTAQEMQQMFKEIEPLVNSFAADLWKLDKNTIHISVEPYQTKHE